MVRSSGETCESPLSPMSDDQGSDSNSTTTWHHGLIARWWANFNLDGPEIEFFRPYVASGQPTLDVGCGSGRLLVPWVADGLDVDGVDASAPTYSPAACWPSTSRSPNSTTIAGVDGNRGQPTSDHRPDRPAGSGLTASSTRCATGSPASRRASVA